MYTHMQHRHTAARYTKAVLHAFSIALHACQNTVQISWKSLISTGLTVHQFFMSRQKLKRQWWLVKAKPACYCCSAQRSSASHMWDMCHSLRLHLSISVIWSVLEDYKLVVNAASEVTNHHTTPHPCCSAARPCRKQRGASAPCLASTVHDYQAVIRLHSVLISSLGLSSYSLQDTVIVKVDDKDLNEGTDLL